MAIRTAPPLTPVRAIALATLVAGALDLGYAIVVSAIVRGAAPTRVMQSVASGLLGKASFDGGIATAALGAALHFAIMAVAVLVFFAASRRWPVLARRFWLYGPIFGAAMFVVMNYVVVPLSAIGQVFHRPPLLFAGELFSHVVFVGATIAWIVARSVVPQSSEGGLSPL